MQPANPLTDSFAQGEKLKSQVQTTSNSMMEEWAFSAKVLIYHYRVILKGMVPFASPLDEKRLQEIEQCAGLDKEAVDYIRHLALMLQKRGE
jgi:hypothetical protein